MIEQEVDYVILGTGVVECAMGCILANKGKKVIMIDRNPVYGSDFATLRYSEVEAYFRTGVLLPELQKHDTSFSIDLTPKMLLADSKMFKMLVKYKIDDYIEFTTIPGSFVWKRKLHSVPTNETQSVTSGVVGMWQKPKVMRFFWNVRDYAKAKMERRPYKFKKTMREEFEGYGLSEESMEFIGHAVALNLDDSYLERSPEETFDKIVLYVRSIMCYEHSLESPYWYPRYGFSEIAQGFARNCCTREGEIMINAEVQEIDTEDVTLVVREPVNGSLLRIKAQKIIADQSYFQEQVVVREIIRAIYIVRGGTEELTRGASSAQVIFLKSELKRKNDIFAVVLGSHEAAAPKGHKVVIVSTVRETQDPEREIEIVTKCLRNVVRSFIDVKPVYRTPDRENVIFTKGVDESPHLESVYDEIESICRKLDIKEF
jgi:Rab GDP dissociation inhibitor